MKNGKNIKIYKYIRKENRTSVGLGEEGYYKIQRNKYERKITPAFGKNPNGNHKQKSQEKHRENSADF